MVVSWNRATPKSSSTLVGFPLINKAFLGTPHWWNPHPIPFDMNQAMKRLGLHLCAWTPGDGMDDEPRSLHRIELTIEYQNPWCSMIYFWLFIHIYIYICTYKHIYIYYTYSYSCLSTRSIDGHATMYESSQRNFGHRPSVAAVHRLRIFAPLPKTTWQTNWNADI